MKEYKFYKRQLIYICLLMLLLLMILIFLLIFTFLQLINYDYDFVYIFSTFIVVMALFILCNEGKNYIKYRFHNLDYIRKILSKDRYDYFDHLFLEYCTGSMRKDLKKINKRASISISKNTDNEPSVIKISGICCKNLYNFIHIKRNLILLVDFLGEKSLRLFY